MTRATREAPLEVAAASGGSGEASSAGETIWSSGEGAAAWVQAPPLPGDGRADAAPPLTVEGGQWVWTGEGPVRGGVVPTVRYFRWDVAIPAEQAAAAVLVATAHDAFEGWINGRAVAREAYGSRAACQRLERGLLRPGLNRIAIEAVNAGGQVPGLCLRLGIDGELWDLGDSARWSAAAAAGWQVEELDDLGWSPAARVAAVDEGVWDVPETILKRLPPAAMLRRVFSCGAVQRAVLTATALGDARLWIDGRPVTDAWLFPGWTDYRRRALCRSFDVTELLRDAGEHVISAELADGWYCGYQAMNVGRDYYGRQPKLRARLVLELESGRTQVLDTDTAWRCGIGGTLEADHYHGFRYDAAREPIGWKRPGFDDTAWPAAEVVKGKEGDGLPAVIEPHPAPPVREVGVVRPTAVEQTGEAVWRVDFGQNLVGVLRLRLHGPAERVEVRYAEMLGADGGLYTMPLRGARCTDIFENIGPGTWEPRFTFHGFRYAEVRGLPQSPAPGDIEAVVLSSDLPQTGRFDCDDEALNRLWLNAWWSQRGNFLDVPTDCPQRDERAGWTGDAQVFLPTAAWNMDVRRFFGKWLADVADAQRGDGAMSDIAPNMVPGDRSRYGNAGWGDAAILCPHRLWWVYGDTNPIRRLWDPMRRHLDYLLETSENGLRHAGLYGDWLDQDGGTDPMLIGTAYLQRCAAAMGQMAQALGEDAAGFEAVTRQVRQAFADTFVAADGRVGSGTLTAYAMALQFELVPDGLLKKTGECFGEAVEERGCRVVTGFLGTPILLPALTRIGRSDLAWKTLLNDAFPSWLFTVRQGATTTWERWDGRHLDRGFGNPAMNSFNHYAYGSVVQWFYEAMAGIQPLEPGFGRVTVRPQLPPPELGPTRVTCGYDSVCGPIAVTWLRGGGDAKGVTLDVELPGGVEGEVVFPWGGMAKVGGGKHRFESR